MIYPILFLALLIPCATRSMRYSFHALLFPCATLSMRYSFHALLFPCATLSMRYSFHALLFPCATLSMSYSFHALLVPCAKLLENMQQKTLQQNFNLRNKNWKLQMEIPKKNSCPHYETLFQHHWTANTPLYEHSSITVLDQYS